MRNLLLAVGLVLVLVLSSTAFSQETVVPETKEIDVELRAGLLSKYVWYGEDVFNDRGALNAGITYALPDAELPVINTNLKDVKIDISTYLPLCGGSTGLTEGDYKISWQKIFLAGDKWETAFSIHYLYYDLYKANASSDGHELGLAAAFTKCLEIGGNPLIPSVYFAKLSDVDDNNNDDMTTLNYNGEVVILGLDYLLPTGKGIVLDIYGNLAYRSGLNAGDNEFGYSNIGVKTEIPINDDTKIAPFVNCQMTMDKDLRGDDGYADVWGGLMVITKF